MKVLAINGSPHGEGNTAILIDEVLAQLERAGIATEHISLSGYKLSGCLACGACVRHRALRCAQEDDGFNELLLRMAQADGIILGSPVHFSDVTPNMKALIDRTGSVSIACGGVLRRKVGAAVAAVRRAGALHTLDSMNHLFQCSEMIVVGSSYWNLAIGREGGAVKADAEGLATMQVLGDGMAWLLLRLAESGQTDGSVRSESELGQWTVA
jgi:multimeric flavodoxin WrbA